MLLQDCPRYSLALLSASAVRIPCSTEVVSELWSEKHQRSTVLDMKGVLLPQCLTRLCWVGWC